MVSQQYWLPVLFLLGTCVPSLPSTWNIFPWAFPIFVLLQSGCSSDVACSRGLPQMPTEAKIGPPLPPLSSPITLTQSIIFAMLMTIWNSVFLCIVYLPTRTQVPWAKGGSMSSTCWTLLGPQGLADFPIIIGTGLTGWMKNRKDEEIPWPPECLLLIQYLLSVSLDKAKPLV